MGGEERREGRVEGSCGGEDKGGAMKGYGREDEERRKQEGGHREYRGARRDMKKRMGI